LLCGAVADEDVGVPSEKFSPCLGVSVRGLRYRRCGGNAVKIMPHFIGFQPRNGFITFADPSDIGMVL
jgi:hypothetical protein